jgi:hypothetical protein
MRSLLLEIKAYIDGLTVEGKLFVFGTPLWSAFHSTEMQISDGTHLGFIHLLIGYISDTILCAAFHHAVLYLTKSKSVHK